MVPLDPSNLAHLQAAQDFLRASQPADAAQEMAKIDAAVQNCAEVLEVRWEIHAQHNQWEKALSVAEQMCAAAPDQAHGWLCRACCLAELDRIQEAVETLNVAHSQFPNDPGIVYNLACFCCTLGRRSDAIAWFDKAMKNGGRAETKLMAMDDPDLQPLMDYVCSL